MGYPGLEMCLIRMGRTDVSPILPHIYMFLSYDATPGTRQHILNLRSRTWRHVGRRSASLLGMPSALRRETAVLEKAPKPMWSLPLELIPKRAAACNAPLFASR